MLPPLIIDYEKSNYGTFDDFFGQKSISYENFWPPLSPMNVAYCYFYVAYYAGFMTFSSMIELINKGGTFNWG